MSMPARFAARWIVALSVRDTRICSWADFGSCSIGAEYPEAAALCQYICIDIAAAVR
jgi:hypothetical protein